MSAGDLVQIPNGDYIRRPGTAQERPDTIAGANQEKEDPVEAAIAAAKEDPNRPSYKCPWCGQESPDEDAFQDHIVGLHGTAIGQASVDARDDEQAVAAMAAARRREQE